MKWHSLFKYLKYVPRMIWVSCVLGIAIILLQNRAAREEHQQLSKQKQLSAAKIESIYEVGGDSVKKTLSAIEETALTSEISPLPEYLPTELTPIVMQAPLQQNPETPPAILPIYQELYNQNCDLAGWLIIEGTVVDYPVMQCGDNEFYLQHNFKKEDSKYGELFAKAGCSLDSTGTNIIIYGHDMSDGSMFGSLKNYENPEVYEKHPYIQFDTLYEQFTYEIIAVFRSQVYKENEDVFQYYQHYGELAEEDFMKFYQNIKEMSLYDTGVEAAFGDNLLTLSTCAYHVKNGRFVVVAKRIL